MTWTFRRQVGTTDSERGGVVVWCLLLIASAVMVTLLFTPQNDETAVLWPVEPEQSESSQSVPESRSEEPAPASQLEANLSLCEQIASDYYKSHQYMGDDVFDCDNMAADVWNMLVAKGINARIVIGNVDRFEAELEDINHAWVLAEIETDQWLAIETTGGYVVYYEDNPNYYWGIQFNNPKELRDFTVLWAELTQQQMRYQQAAQRYEWLAEQYNAADGLARLALLPEVSQASGQVEAEAARLNELNQQLQDLIAEMETQRG